MIQPISGTNLRVIVSGDRNWADREFVFRRLSDIHKTSVIGLLIEGCARGADTFAEQWAAANSVTLEHFPAAWDAEGKSAGPKRNERMAASGADLLVAFHDDLTNSKGTGHMVRTARAAKIRVLHAHHPGTPAVDWDRVLAKPTWTPSAPPAPQNASPVFCANCGAGVPSAAVPPPGTPAFDELFPSIAEALGQPLEPAPSEQPKPQATPAPKAPAKPRASRRAKPAA